MQNVIQMCFKCVTFVIQKMRIMAKVNKVRYSFLFNRRAKKLKKDEKAPIELQVYFSRLSRIFLKTNVEIEAQFWDEQTEMASKNILIMWHYINILRCF